MERENQTKEIEISFDSIKEMTIKEVVKKETQDEENKTSIN